MATTQPLQLVTFEQEQWYRGVTSNGQVLYTLADVFEVNHETLGSDLFNPDAWLPSVDEESCFIAARCSSCGKEFRPIDGFVPTDGFLEKSYCARC